MMQRNMAHITDQGRQGESGRGGDGHFVRVNRPKTIVIVIAVELCTKCFHGCDNINFKCVTGDSGSTAHRLY